MSAPANEAAARARASIKQRGRRGDQIRRRERLMASQKRARRDMLTHARSLVAESHEERTGAGASGKDTGGASHPTATAASTAAAASTATATRGRSALAAYWRRFMSAEWLVDVPPDLAGGWLVMPRPEGRRCLVVASHGRCVARDQNGRRVARWRGAVPGGGGARSHGFTVLDCIDGYDAHGACTFVLDVMAWDGNLYYDCDAEFRFFWRDTKLAEVAADQLVYGRNERRLVPIPYAECDVASLRLAHDGAFPFERDGLLFYAKACHYAPGVSPGVLQFRDHATSRWFCASNANATFHTTEDGHVVSTDDEPHRVCSVLPEVAAALGVSPGDFVKVQLVCAGEHERTREAAAAHADMQRATTRVTELRALADAQRAVGEDTRAAERDLRGWESQVAQLQAAGERRAQVAAGTLTAVPLGDGGGSSEDGAAIPHTVVALTGRASRWRWFGDSWTRLLFMSQLTQGVLSYDTILTASQQQQQQQEEPSHVME